MALATLPGVAYAADIFPDGRLYARELSAPEVRLASPGHMTAPDTPGSGFRPLPERLDEMLIARA